MLLLTYLGHIVSRNLCEVLQRLSSIRVFMCYNLEQYCLAKVTGNIHGSKINGLPHQ